MTECVVAQKVSERDLARFTCTQEYHRHNQYLFPFLLLTDGCHFLRERAQCYWLFDAIGSHLFHNRKIEPYRQKQQGMFWELTVEADKSAILTCSWDTNEEIDGQAIAFTDIGNYTDIKTVRIWTFPTFLEGQTVWICLLPSEY